MTISDQQLQFLRGCIRSGLAVLGGYWLSAQAVSLSAALFAGFGLAASEAVVLASLLGFVYYLAILLWGFAMPSLRRLLGWFLALGLLLLALRQLFGATA